MWYNSYILKWGFDNMTNEKLELEQLKKELESLYIVKNKMENISLGSKQAIAYRGVVTSISGLLMALSTYGLCEFIPRVGFNYSDGNMLSTLGYTVGSLALTAAIPLTSKIIKHEVSFIPEHISDIEICERNSKKCDNEIIDIQKKVLSK